MTAPQSPAPGAPADTGTGGQAPAGPQPTTQPTGPALVEQPQDVSALPEWAQKIITDTRSEAAKYRTGQQTAAQQAQAAEQQRNAVLQVLGINPDGTNAPPDATKLAAQLEQQQTVAKSNAVELSVFRVAAPAGADADALLDSRGFLDSLIQFREDDPASPEFRQKLEAHIRAYVEQNPKFKAQNGATTSRAPRAEMGGRKPGGAAMTPMEMLAAQVQGGGQQ